MSTDPWIIFATAVIIALAGALVRGVLSVVRSLANMSKSIDKLLAADIDHMLAIAAIAKLQRPQRAAHKATLEALQDGKCNGNVKDAKAQIVAAFDEYDEFLVGRL
jgi:hypothetical protein